MNYFKRVLVALSCVSATTADYQYHLPSYTPVNANCHDYTIPVTLTSENYQWTGPRWNDNYEFIDFLTVASFRPSLGLPLPFGNLTEETGSYKIAGTFCAPKKRGPKSKTILLATHGLGCDRNYWNSAKEPEKYNFVQYATERGYSVFFYDRLGVGLSSKISAFKIQASIQAAVLASLTKLLRQGQYLCPKIGKPESIILVGHSYGSATSNAALAEVPSLVDAAILTGYGLNGSSLVGNLQGFAPRIARLQNPRRFSLFDYAYTVTADVYATITIFFKAPDYDRAIARFLDAIKQPFSLFEILTFGGTVVPKYTGPVLVISGEFDYPICGGPCTDVLDDGLKGIFPSAKVVDTYVQPGAGHGTNFAKNATGFYGEIFAWLGRQGF